MRYAPSWFVYRLIAADDSTLYVGMTRNFSQRMTNHYSSEYGDQIVSVATERYRTEREAADREAALIRELAPPLNRDGIEAVDPVHRGYCRCGRATVHGNTKVCGGCMEGYYARYLDGDGSMSTLAREAGVSRERMRQVFLDLSDGVPAVHLRNAIKRERAGVQAEIEAQRWALEAERAGVTCRTCGRPHSRRWHGGWAQNCSTECSQMWGTVRLIADDGEYEAHRQRVARWNLRHADQGDDIRTRHATRVLHGEDERRGRWLQPGSARWEIACRAYREGWPTFATWPEDVQEQIREHFSEVAA